MDRTAWRKRSRDVCIAAYECIFSGHICGYHGLGSYADGAAMSDIDLAILAVLAGQYVVKKGEAMRLYAPLTGGEWTRG